MVSIMKSSPIMSFRFRGGYLEDYRSLRVFLKRDEVANTEGMRYAVVMDDCTVEFEIVGTDCLKVIG